MKMKCGILESCVAIVTKHKSSKGIPKLTFIEMSLKLRKEYLNMEVSVFSIND